MFTVSLFFLQSFRKYFIINHIAANAESQLTLGGLMNKNQRIALAEKDLQVKDVGNFLGCHSGHMTNILSGRYKSPKIRKKICEILGKSESYLWPDETSIETKLENESE